MKRMSTFFNSFCYCVSGKVKKKMRIEQQEKLCQVQPKKKKESKLSHSFQEKLMKPHFLLLLIATLSPSHY